MTIRAGRSPARKCTFRRSPRKLAVLACAARSTTSVDNPVGDCTGRPYKRRLTFELDGVSLSTRFPAGKMYSFFSYDIFKKLFFFSYYVHALKFTFFYLLRFYYYFFFFPNTMPFDIIHHTTCYYATAYL